MGCFRELSQLVQNGGPKDDDAGKNSLSEHEIAA
jgi:hypothetical protein